MRCARTDPGCRVNAALQRGVVLIAVLWMLVLLSLIATNLSLGGRGFARQALNTEMGYQAGLAADSGLVWALWNLQQRGRAGWLADGGAHRMQLGDAQIRVALYDESGKVDLNTAPTELLDGVFAAAVGDAGERQSLVAAIEDWRDADSLVRLNGAEEEQYLAAGRSTGPANRDFADVSELTQVLGMTPKIYAKVRWSLTVLNKTRTVNPQVAPFQVLMALPNASPGVVERYIEERRQAWADGLALPQLPFDAAPYVSTRRTGFNYTAMTEAVLPPARIRRVAALTRRGVTIQVEHQRVLLDEAVLPAASEADRAGG